MYTTRKIKSLAETTIEISRKEGDEFKKINS
jgi:hypothetical protein